mmetsp:Transcript_9034/g.30126  ORF Transcript_9034/g.30126 Transcript_9034/m.30126 type:complete len:267 (+) Transcript_9034:410-1210(+)
MGNASRSIENNESPPSVCGEKGDALAVGKGVRGATEVLGVLSALDTDTSTRLRLRFAVRFLASNCRTAFREAFAAALLASARRAANIEVRDTLGDSPANKSTEKSDSPEGVFAKVKSLDVVAVLSLANVATLASVGGTPKVWKPSSALSTSTSASSNALSTSPESTACVVFRFPSSAGDSNETSLARSSATGPGPGNNPAGRGLFAGAKRLCVLPIRRARTDFAFADFADFSSFACATAPWTKYVCCESVTLAVPATASNAEQRLV